LHLYGARIRPSSVDPSLAPFDEVVVGAMACNPAHRPASVTELLFGLERACRAATSPSPGARGRMPVR
jgi:hypothetical protein